MIDRIKRSIGVAAWTLGVGLAAVNGYAQEGQVGAGATTAPAVGAGAARVTPPGPNDYSQDKAWICRPGREDACAIDQSRTQIAADGALTVQPWEANAAAPVDCFYVYPTVSLDPGGNSDMELGLEERSVVAAQLARFASQCRLFAPLYRQITLTALRRRTAGESVSADRELAYADVVDAWKHYLENDNDGRGFVLIGHSQGSGMLTQLVRNEIDGKPIQKQLVSAMLIGSNIPVPKGKDVGGAFQNIPLCRSSQQLGCLITYVSFRENVPPPPESRFGKVAEPGQVAACTNPAALAGGRGELDAHLRRASFPGITTESADPVLEKVETPYYTLPGMLSAECVEDERGSYLSVRVDGKAEDARMDDIPGDVITDGKVAAEWGLHLVDVGIAMGNLESILADQAKAYVAKQ